MNANYFVTGALLSLLVLSCNNPLWPIKEDVVVFNCHASATPVEVLFPGKTANNRCEMIAVTFGSASTDHFIIGEDEEDSAKEVTVNAFKLGKYEVSYNLWYTVYTWATDSVRGNNMYVFAHPGSEGLCSNGTLNGSNLHMNYPNKGNPPSTSGMPVGGINWRDAIVWCNAFSEMCGLDPVYYILNTDGAEEVYRNALYAVEDGGKIDSSDSTPGCCSSDLTTLRLGGKDNPIAKKTANGYRLPYEYEWEYAARKCSDGTFISGKAISGDKTGTVEEASLLDAIDGKTFVKSRIYSKYAWHMHNSPGKSVAKSAAGWDESELPTGMTASYRRTHKQGCKLPNDLGFYDMSGNLPEWCFDFALPYGSLKKSYTLKARRGGTAWYDERLTKTGDRGGSWTTSADGGFRIAQNY